MKSLLHLLLAAAATLSAVAADPVEIKLATILPAGTSGHQRLMEMRDAWSRASGQSVKLSVQAGTGDGEIQIVRHLRSKRLQAALVSAVGLAQIDRSVTCLQLMPLAFRDWREVDYVREKIRGDLEERLRQKGFEVLFWADAGWVRFFSRAPAVRPADLKPMKMFVWAGDPQQLTILRSLGYQPVGLETEAILTSLSTGMIDVVPVPPFLANAVQYSRYAGNMIDLNWAPIVGAAIVQRETWEQIPASLRATLLASATGAGARLREHTRAEDDDAIAAMRKRGLKVHAVTPEITAEWRATVDRVYPQIRGSLVPADLFDQVQAHLAEFRRADLAKEKP